MMTEVAPRAVRLVKRRSWPLTARVGCGRRFDIILILSPALPAGSFSTISHPQSVSKHYAVGSLQLIVYLFCAELRAFEPERLGMEGYDA